MAITSKVIDGRYNFDQNVLELDIETTTPGAGNEEATVVTKRRKFDVTSLKVTKAAHEDQAARDIEVLGARTQAAMDDIMPKIIASFKAMSNCQSLIGRVSDSTQTSSVKFEMNRDVDATATLAAYQGGTVRQVMKDVSGSVVTTSKDLKPGVDGQYVLSNHGRSESIIQNPQVVSQLLKASSWESMIKDVEGDSAKDPNHEWPSSETLKATTQQLDDVLKLFTQTKQASDGVKRDKLGDACVHLTKKLTPQLPNLDQLISQINRNKNSLNDLLTTDVEFNSDDWDAIKKHFEEQLKLEEDLNHRIDCIENGIPMLLKELAIMMSVKSLKDQKNVGKGQAPMGTMITKEWDDLVSKFELLPSTTEKSLEEHVNNKLGLGFSEIPDKNELKNNCDKLIEEIKAKLEQSAAVVAPPPIDNEDDLESQAPILAFTVELNPQGNSEEIMPNREPTHQSLAPRLDDRVEDRQPNDEDIKQVLRTAITDGNEQIIADLRKMPIYEKFYEQVKAELAKAAEN